MPATHRHVAQRLLDNVSMDELAERISFQLLQAFSRMCLVHMCLVHMCLCYILECLQTSSEGPERGLCMQLKHSFSLRTCDGSHMWQLADRPQIPVVKRLCLEPS